MRIAPISDSKMEQLGVLRSVVKNGENMGKSWENRGNMSGTCGKSGENLWEDQGLGAIGVSSQEIFPIQWGRVRSYLEIPNEMIDLRI